MSFSGSYDPTNPGGDGSSPPPPYDPTDLSGSGAGPSDGGNPTDPQAYSAYQAADAADDMHGGSSDTTVDPTDLSTPAPPTPPQPTTDDTQKHSATDTSTSDPTNVSPVSDGTSAGISAPPPSASTSDPTDLSGSGAGPSFGGNPTDTSASAPAYDPTDLSHGGASDVPAAQGAPGSAATPTAAPPSYDPTDLTDRQQTADMPFGAAGTQAPPAQPTSDAEARYRGALADYQNGTASQDDVAQAAQAYTDSLTAGLADQAGYVQANELQQNDAARQANQQVMQYGADLLANTSPGLTAPQSTAPQSGFEPGNPNVRGFSMNPATGKWEPIYIGQEPVNPNQVISPQEAQTLGLYRTGSGVSDLPAPSLKRDIVDTALFAAPYLGLAAAPEILAAGLGPGIGVSGAGLATSYLGGGVGPTVGTLPFVGPALSAASHIPGAAGVTNTIANAPIPQPLQNPGSQIMQTLSRTIQNVGASGGNPVSIVTAAPRAVWQQIQANAGGTSDPLSIIHSFMTEDPKAYAVQTALQKDAGPWYVVTQGIISHDPRNGIGAFFHGSDVVQQFDQGAAVAFQQGGEQGVQQYVQTHMNGAAALLKSFDLFNPYFFALKVPGLEELTKGFFSVPGKLVGEGFLSPGEYARGIGGAAGDLFRGAAPATETLTEDEALNAARTPLALGRNPAGILPQVQDVIGGITTKSGADILTREESKYLPGMAGSVVTAADGSQTTTFRDGLQSLYNIGKSAVTDGYFAPTTQDLVARHLATYGGGTPEHVLAMATKLAYGLRENLASATLDATGKQQPVDIARALDARMAQLAQPEYTADLSRTIRATGFRRGAADAELNQGMAALNDATRDLRAANYRQAGVPLVNSQGALGKTVQFGADALRTLFLLPTAPALALKKIVDEAIRGATQGVYGVRPQDLTLVRGAAHLLEGSRFSPFATAGRAIEDSSTLRTLTRAGVPIDSGLLRTPLSDRARFSPFRVTDKVLDSLVSSPTQHLRLNAAYQATRGFRESIPEVADALGAHVADALGPDAGQLATSEFLRAPTNETALRWSARIRAEADRVEGAAPRVPSTAGQSRFSATAPSPRVTRDIARTGAQPGMVRSVQEGVPTVAQPSDRFAYKPREDVAPAASGYRQWAHTVLDGSGAGFTVPQAVRQEARTAGIPYLGETPQQFATKIRDTSITPGQAAGAAAATRPVAPPTRAAQAAEIARRIKDAGGDITAVSRDEFIQMEAWNKSNRVVDTGKATPSGKIGGRTQRVFPQDRAAWGSTYDHALAARGGVGDMAAGDGGAGYLSRQFRAIRDDVNAMGGLGTQRTLTYGQSTGAPRSARQGAQDLRAGNIRGGLTADLSTKGTLDNRLAYLNRINPGESESAAGQQYLRHLKDYQVAANTEMSYANKELDAGLHIGNEAKVYHDLAELDRFANGLAEIRAGIDPTYTTDRLAQPRFGAEAAPATPTVSDPTDLTTAAPARTAPAMLGSGLLPARLALPQGAIARGAPLYAGPYGIQSAGQFRAQELRGLANTIEARGAQFASGQGAAGLAAATRGNQIVGDLRHQSVMTDILKHGTIAGRQVFLPILPFAEFHLATTGFWARYILQHPGAPFAIAQALSHLDPYGAYTIRNADGSTTRIGGVAGLSSALTLGLWARNMTQYALDGIRNPNGNNPLQLIAKNLAYNTVGNNPFIGTFPYISAPGQALAQAGTRPLTTAKGAIDPRDMMQTTSGRTALGGLLTRFGVPGNIATATNLGADLSNASEAGVARLTGSNLKQYNPQSQLPYFAGNFAKAQGWSPPRAQAAINDAMRPGGAAPQTPDGTALLAAYNRQQGNQDMQRLFPLQITTEGNAKPLFPSGTSPSLFGGVGKNGVPILPGEGIAQPGSLDDYYTNMLPEERFRALRAAGGLSSTTVTGLKDQQANIQRVYGKGSPEDVALEKQLIDARANYAFPGNTQMRGYADTPSGYGAVPLSEHQITTRSVLAQTERLNALDNTLSYGFELPPDQQAAKLDVMRYDAAHAQVQQSLTQAGYYDAVNRGDFRTADKIAASVPGGTDYVNGLAQLKEQVGYPRVQLAEDAYKAAHPELTGLATNPLTGQPTGYDLAQLQPRPLDTTVAKQRFIYQQADPGVQQALIDRENLRSDLFRANPSFSDLYGQYLGITDTKQAADFKAAHPELFNALSAIDARVATDDGVNPAFAELRQQEYFQANPGQAGGNALWGGGYTAGQQVYYEQLNPAQRAAYDQYEAWKQSPDGQAYARVIAAEDASGPYGSPGEYAWYTANRAELAQVTNARNAAIQQITAQTGANPLAVSNQIGQVEYPDFHAANINPKDITATSGSGYAKSSSGKKSYSPRGPSANTVAGDTFYGFYDSLTKPQKTNVLHALDNAGLTVLGVKGLNAATYNRATAIAKAAANTPTTGTSASGGTSPATDFYNFYDGLTKPEQQNLRDALASAGVTIFGQKGLPAATYERGITIAEQTTGRKVPRGTPYQGPGATSTSTSAAPSGTGSTLPGASVGGPELVHVLGATAAERAQAARGILPSDYWTSVRAPTLPGSGKSTATSTSASVPTTLPGSGKSTSSSASGTAGTDFYAYYRTLSKTERAAVLHALDSAGITILGATGVPDATFTRALGIARSVTKKAA